MTEGEIVMRMKKWVQALLVIALMFTLTACDDVVKPNGKDGDKPSPNKQVVYEIIAEEKLPEALKAWYLEKYKLEGIHVEKHEGKQYVILSAGEKPTGGFRIDNVTLTPVDTIIKVTAELVVPGPDDMVTQALTYPSVLIEMEADDRQLQFDGFTINQPEASIIEETGTYIGRIDLNSIEIKISGVPENSPDAFRAFQLSDTAKEQIETIQDGDAVNFEYEVREGQQDLVHSIKKISQ